MKKISSKLFDELDRDARLALKKSLFEEFRADPEELCGRFGDSELMELIDTAFDNADPFKIETDRGLSAFSMMTILCGPEFCQEPDVSRYLRQDDPDTRIEELLEYYLHEYQE